MTVIACTLSPTEMSRRGDEVRALGRDGLLSASRGSSHVVLRFRSESDIRARVERIVAAESRCCAFMDFELTEDRAALVLTVTAPPGGELAVHALAYLFEGHGQEIWGRTRS